MPTPVTDPALLEKLNNGGGAKSVTDPALLSKLDAAPDHRSALDKLLGIGGERYQTFPERMARVVVGAVETGAELTKKAATGEYGPTGEGLSQENPGKILSAASVGVSAAPEAAAGLGEAAMGRSFALNKALPTKEAVKDSAKVAYKAVEDARLTVTPESVQTFASNLTGALDQKLISNVSAPRTFQAIGQLEKSEGNLAKIMNVYSELGGVKPAEGTDFAAAQIARDGINNYIEHLPDAEVISGDPQFTQAMAQHARSSWRSYAELEQIDSAMKIGEHRAAVSGTGANTQNAMRQRIREIFDNEAKSRGYSTEAKKQAENIIMGTWLTNAARFTGKFAPSGPVSMSSTFTAGLTGFLTSGMETGAIAAAAVAIPTTIAKYLGTFLTRRQINELENIIRSESPLGKAAKSKVEQAPRRAISKGAEAALPGALPMTATDVQSYLDGSR